MNCIQGIYLKHLVERVESWWAPPWVGGLVGTLLGGPNSKWWMGAPAACWRDHPTPPPVAKHPQWTNTKWVGGSVIVLS